MPLLCWKHFLSPEARQALGAEAEGQPIESQPEGHKVTPVAAPSGGHHGQGSAFCLKVGDEKNEAWERERIARCQPALI